MKTVENFQFQEKVRKSRNADYFAQVLNGAIWQLTRGEDFDSQPSNHVGLLKKHAKLRNGDLRWQINGNCVVVQFVSYEGEKENGA